MPGATGVVVLALTVLALAATMRVQIRPMGRGRALLDGLALLPEWRFYAQASIGGAVDLARDTHLVIRDRDAGGRPTGWRPVLWTAERGLRHAVWNPEMRVEGLLLGMADDLARAEARGDTGPNTQQSLPYLTLLRVAVAAPAAPHGAIDCQFAVVHTVGRGARAPAIGFLSAWHRR